MKQTLLQTLTRIVLIGALALLVGGITLHAQETTPEIAPTDTPTDTAVPTDTPTDTPVPTDTPTETPIPPSETPTDTPTAEQTVSVEPTATGDVTEAPTDTPTLEATALPAEPPLTLLVRELFDNGDLSPWALGAGWSLAPSEGGLALQVSSSNEPAALLKGDFYNAAAQARFLLNAGAAQISLRVSAVGSYTASVDASGLVSLYRNGELLASAAVAPGVPGQWRILRLSAMGDVLRVAVDNVEALVVSDSAPLPPGGVTLSGAFALPADGSVLPENTLLVDDFFLWLPSAEIGLYPTPTSSAPMLPPTATDTPTELPTETPTDTPTSAPLPPVTGEVVYEGKVFSAAAPPSEAQIAASILGLSNDNLGAPLRCRT